MFIKHLPLHDPYTMSRIGRPRLSTVGRGLRTVAHMKVFRNVSEYDSLQSTLSHKDLYHKPHTDSVSRYDISHSCLYDHKIYKIFGENMYRKI